MDGVAFFVDFGDELFPEIGTVSCSLLEVKLFDLCGHLVGQGCLIASASVVVVLESIKTTVTVSGECDSLLFFPGLDEALDRVESKHLLLVSELTVLAHGVEADDKLHVLGLELVEGDLGPLLFFFRHPLDTACQGLFFRLGLALIPSFTLLILGNSASLYVLPVGDSFSERFIEKATLVDKRNCHEAAEARNPLEMHPWLAHNLLDIYMLEPVHQAVLLLYFLSFIVDRRFYFAETCILFCEDIVRDSNSRLQDGTFDEFM